MPRYIVDLQISEPELARFYGGQARQVRAQSRCGTWLAFPAQWLRSFVDHQGVRGSFLLETDAQHRLRAFQRL